MHFLPLITQRVMPQESRENVLLVMFCFCYKHNSEEVGARDVYELQYFYIEKLILYKNWL